MEMKLGSVHCATFSIISAQNALETALLDKEKRVGAEYIVNTPEFTPFKNYKIRSRRVGSGVCSPLWEKS